MKYDTNCKIEFSVRKSIWPYKHREVYYRIKPDELNIFKRLFGNPWRQLYHAFTCSPGKSTVFTPKEFQKLQERLKTFGDVCDYLEEVNEEMKIRDKAEAERHAAAVKNGEEWEDY